jgi:ABC-type multidrug transport system ATPase subunit
VLGEGGSLISSGERQLIAIARAFARNPQLILFDEATSYIDSQTELLIQQALERLMRQRTALVVAHRLSTVRHAQRILVMNRGRIIESGSHPELMALQGSRAGAIIPLPNPESDAIGFFLNVISELSGFGPQHSRRKRTRAFPIKRFTRLSF